MACHRTFLSSTRWADCAGIKTVGYNMWAPGAAKLPMYPSCNQLDLQLAGLHCLQVAWAATSLASLHLTETCMTSATFIFRTVCCTMLFAADTLFACLALIPPITYMQDAMPQLASLPSPAVTNANKADVKPGRVLRMVCSALLRPHSSCRICCSRLL